MMDERDVALLVVKVHLFLFKGNILGYKTVRTVKARDFFYKPVVYPFCGMPLFSGCLPIPEQPTVNYRLVIVQFWAQDIRIGWLRLWWVEIGHVQVFDYGLTVMPSFFDNGGYVFALLIIELSDKMYLVHCKHTPFLLRLLSATTILRIQKINVCLQWIFDIPLNPQAFIGLGEYQISGCNNREIPSAILGKWGCNFG